MNLAQCFCFSLMLSQAALCVACNQNPVVYLSSAGQVTVTTPVSVSAQTKMDILWVIDNSNSMCQEQQVLRDNFNQFVEEVEQASLDFHIGVTTTHYPQAVESASLFPKSGSIRSQLQRYPQPIPATVSECVQGEGMYDPDLLSESSPMLPTKFLPIQQSLAVARSCLKPELASSDFVWRDAQISCALSGNKGSSKYPCDPSDAIPDRNQDSLVNADDLYPDPGAASYREVPLVLRAQDYISASGGLDAEQLRRDFNCMASVGTLGFGIEKGLRAAVDAVSLEKTGGAFGAADSVTDAPNHGLIRGDAGFTLIFVTDENDCSHDGKITELGGVELCEDIDALCSYENSVAVEDKDTRLTFPEALAQEFRENLALTKGVDQVPEEQIIMAGIYGTSKRYDKAYPDCAIGNETPAVPSVCTTTLLGSSSSGDRYERFIRQFSRFYPNGGITEEERLDFSKSLGTGEMCKPAGFGGALRAIGQFIQAPARSCIKERLLSCTQDSDCPSLVGTGEQGVCKDSGEGAMWCASAVTLKLVAKQVDAEFDEKSMRYCEPGTQGFFDNESSANCIVAYDAYTMEACGSGGGVQFRWSVDATDVNRALDGKFDLEMIYSIEPTSAMSEVR